MAGQGLVPVQVGEPHAEPVQGLQASVSTVGECWPYPLLPIIPADQASAHTGPCGHSPTAQPRPSHLSRSMAPVSAASLPLPLTSLVCW